MSIIGTIRIKQIRDTDDVAPHEFLLLRSLADAGSGVGTSVATRGNTRSLSTKSASGMRNKKKPINPMSVKPSRIHQT
ncbi:MAG: hypothetical protein MZW92_33690 [Comamonadaceae bacterium]|nr:hypothetical protein [Comamonadaceae bacterium]